MGEAIRVDPRTGHIDEATARRIEGTVTEALRRDLDGDVRLIVERGGNFQRTGQFNTRLEGVVYGERRNTYSNTIAAAALPPANFARTVGGMQAAEARWVDDAMRSFLRSTPTISTATESDLDVVAAQIYGLQHRRAGETDQELRDRCLAQWHRR